MSHANEDVVLDGLGDVTPLFMQKSANAVEWQSLYHGISDFRISTFWLHQQDSHKICRTHLGTSVDLIFVSCSISSFGISETCWYQ